MARTLKPFDSIRTFSSIGLGLLTVSGLAWSLCGCSRPVPRDALVVAESPVKRTPEPPRDILDARCPGGSRVVITTTGPKAKTIRVLSDGMVAAGEPVISCDARRIVFAGKTTPQTDWQIYEALSDGGGTRRITSVPGGAMDPALLADGSLLFVSPVPKMGVSTSQGGPPAIYAQPPGGSPRRLSFGFAAVRDPTVLSDGRILFVSSLPGAGMALFTMNNDGTEISAFAGQHDEPRSIQRPREIENGKIVFTVAEPSKLEPQTAETVLSARPFRSRATLLPNSKALIRAVQPAENGDLLVCARPESRDDISGCAVFKLRSNATALEAPLFEERGWNITEAVQVSAFRRPMGRISNVDLSHQTGQILCLDVNNSSYVVRADEPAPRAERIRVFTQNGSAKQSVLGEVKVQADGSFMADVPADLPLGFETLDDQGRVLRREPALIWVRPGENRSCIGCHEPHNHSPRNSRPLAVQVPVPRLPAEPMHVAQNRR